MGSIVSGILGGGSGNSYQPAEATIQSPATVDQANQQYANVQTGLQNQQNFLNAVQGQQGLQNQSNVFNQLQGVANGTGPNPAQAMLANATGANTANQAALMAGQRGTSANTGLIARQAAMQGAANQQNAAGQGAALQANQSLNALNQMGGIATNQANQQANATNAYTNAATGAQQNILGAITGQNNANVNATSNRNNVSGGIANNVAGQQGDLLGNMVGGIGSAITSLFADGGQVPDGQTQLVQAPQANSNAANFMRDETNASAQSPISNQAPQQHGMAKAGGGIGNMLGGALNMGINALTDGEGLGSLFGGSSLGDTGILGDLTGSLTAGGAGDALGGVGEWLGGVGSALGGAGSALGGAAEALAPVAEDVAMVAAKGGVVPNGPRSKVGMHFHGVAQQRPHMLAKGGTVPALVSPGERYLPPSAVNQVAKGKNPMKAGEKIQGKAQVPGAKNSYANDTVPKTLQSGGIVLPRSVTQAKDAPEKARAFVEAIMAKQGLPKRK